MNYYVIDGNAYIYRAFFAIPAFTSSKGVYTNAVYGFAKMLLKLMKEKDGDRIVVAFDHKKKSFRHEMFEEYKAHRAKMPDEMKSQLPYIKQLVELLNLPVMEIEGMEADDAIASFVTHAPEGSTSYIITGDKDMMQLVNDHVFIFDTMKNVIYDREGVKVKMGVWPEQIPDLLGLMGDSADNIPGVKGIGPKTAVSLLEQYPDMETLLAHADEVKGKTGELLRDQAEGARISKQLATVHCDIDLSHLDLTEAKPDMAGLQALFQELEFFSLIKELGMTEHSSEKSAAVDAPAARDSERIETLAAWESIAGTLEGDLFVHVIPGTPVELLIARVDEGTVYHVACGAADLRTSVLAFLQEQLPKGSPLLTTHSKALYHFLLETQVETTTEIPQLSLFS